MTTFLVLSIALMILNALDIVTTHNAIKSGKGMEGNPVVLWLMRVFGSAWWLPKSVVVALPIISYYYAQESVFAMTTLLILIIGYSYVVYNNYKTWRGNK